MRSHLVVELLDGNLLFDQEVEEVTITSGRISWRYRCPGDPAVVMRDSSVSRGVVRSVLIQSASSPVEMSGLGEN